MGVTEEEAKSAVDAIEPSKLPIKQNNLGKLNTITSYWAGLGKGNSDKEKSKFDKFQTQQKSKMSQLANFKEGSYASAKEDDIKEAVYYSHKIMEFVESIKEPIEGGDKTVELYDTKYKDDWIGKSPIKDILDKFGCKNFVDNKLDKLDPKKSSSKGGRRSSEDGWKELRKVRKIALTYGINEILRKSDKNVNMLLKKGSGENETDDKEKQEDIVNITNTFLNGIGREIKSPADLAVGYKTPSAKDVMGKDDVKKRSSHYSESEYDDDEDEGEYGEVESEGSEQNSSDGDMENEDTEQELPESETENDASDNSETEEDESDKLSPGVKPNSAENSNLTKERLNSPGKGLDAFSKDDFRNKLPVSLKLVCDQIVDRRREDKAVFATLKEQFKDIIGLLNLVGKFEAGFINEAPPLSLFMPNKKGDWEEFFEEDADENGNGDGGTEPHNLKVAEDKQDSSDSDSDAPLDIDTTGLAMYKPENLPILFNKHTPFSIYNFSTRILWDIVGACSQYLTAITSIAIAKSSYIQPDETGSGEKRKKGLFGKIHDRIHEKEIMFKQPLSDVHTLATVEYCKILLQLSRNAIEQASPPPALSDSENAEGSDEQDFATAGGTQTIDFNDEEKVGGNQNIDFRDDKADATQDIDFVGNVDDMKDPWDMMRATLLTASCLIIKNSENMSNLQKDNPQLFGIVHGILYKDIIDGNRDMQELSKSSTDAGTEKSNDMTQFQDKLYNSLKSRLQTIKNSIAANGGVNGDQQELLNSIQAISRAVENKSDFFDASKRWMRKFFDMMDKTGVDDALDMFLGKQYLIGGEIAYIPKFSKETVQTAV